VGVRPKYESKRITGKELARPFCYTRWYNCRNRDCTTTQIMPDEFKVWNANPAEQEVVTTPAPHHDIALDVLDQMGVGDRPPRE
jgi:hypothetical protein